jgi:hypothetical protein
MVWDAGLCDDCRTVATMWMIFLAVAAAGTVLVRLFRRAFVVVALAWLYATYDQLGYLTAETPKPVLLHVAAAVATGILLPALALLVPRRRQAGVEPPAV